MKRHAVLCKLRAGVTRGEVRELIALLKRIGDPQWVENEEKIVKQYEDQYGDPTFYIP